MRPNTLEKIDIEIFPDETEELSRKVAKLIAKKITEKNSKGEKTVLGLATGNTPLVIYRELIRMHKEENLDFSDVVTFNLDEYYGLKSNHINSYHKFMFENLFDHINIKKENIHIPDGTISKEKLEEYTKKIAKRAVIYMNHAGRKTLMESDIKLAILDLQS